MILIRVLLVCLLVVAIAVLAMYHYAINTFIDVPVNPQWQVSVGEQSADDSVRVRFSGTTTL
jgi:hypothetical protein